MPSSAGNTKRACPGITDTKILILMPWYDEQEGEIGYERF
jgi:hypothetical protein